MGQFPMVGIKGLAVGREKGGCEEVKHWTGQANKERLLTPQRQGWHRLRGTGHSSVSPGEAGKRAGAKSRSYHLGTQGHCILRHSNNTLLAQHLLKRE